MRKTILTGLALIVGGVLSFILGSLMDLELEFAALFGVALGGALILIPDRTALVRGAGFLAGFVVAWIGYLVRAAVMPDTTTGRALTLVVVLALCTAIAAGSMGRLPLWSLLLGVVGLVGVYEAAYNVSPSEVASTSVTAATTTLCVVAFGIIAASLAGVDSAKASRDGGRRAAPTNDSSHDELMEHHS